MQLGAEGALTPCQGEENREKREKREKRQKRWVVSLFLLSSCRSSKNMSWRMEMRLIHPDIGKL